MKNGKGSGLQIHTPIPQRTIEQSRESALKQLLRQIVVKAEKEKAKLNGVEGRMALTDKEMDEIAEKTRAHLEKIGWFKPGAGIR